MDIDKIPPLEDFNHYIQDDEVVLIKDAVDKKAQNAPRYKTNYDVFNQAMSGGFKDGDLVIISGISGQGKTTLAQTFTYHFCKQNLPCLWFSYEVSLEHLDNKFQEMGLGDFYHAYSPKKNTTGKLEWIKYKIKEGFIKHGTKLVFIDHIDFLIPTNLKSSDNQAIMLKNIATELKQLAIELKIVIIAMAHLKKLPDGKEPDMQDIGYSAGVFQLADYVLMVYREKNPQYKSFGGDLSGELYTNNTLIKYVKNRETGQLKFIKCQYQNGQFYELVPIQERPERDATIYG